MKIFFCFFTILQVLELVYSYKKTKRIFSIPNIYFVGITINFILYLCDWSTDFTVKCQPLTYCILIISTLIVMVFDLIYLKKYVMLENVKLENYKITKLKYGDKMFISVSSLIIILCLILAICENIITYGMLFPFLNKIDAHKNSVVFFGTLWKAIYPIGLFAFAFEYKENKGKKKSEYLLLIITTLYLLLGSGGRFWPVISVLSFVVFIFNTNKIKLKNIFFMIILGIISLRVLLLMGMSRLNQNYLYSTLIGYNGPFSNTNLGEIFAWYYGYFPYSFHNLNLTLINIDSNSLFTNGRFFIIPFLYVTKLHNLFNLEYIDLALSVRVISNTSATVATAFFEFYADFRYFFFLPIVFLIWIMNKWGTKKTLFAQGTYAYCLIIFFFFNFYNVFSSGIPYTFILLWYLFNKLMVVKRKECMIFINEK